MEEESTKDTHGIVHFHVHCSFARSFYPCASYKIHRDKMNVQTVMVSIDVGGIHTADWKQAAEALLNGLFEDDETQEEEDKRSQSQAPVQQETIPWTRSELRKAIMMSKSGKASGGDYVEVDMLKWGNRAGLLPVLTNLYNGCLKLGVFPKP